MKIGKFLSKNEQAKIKPVEGTIRSEMIDYTTEGVKRSLRANGEAIRAFLAAVLLCVFVGGCRTIQYIPIETGTTVNVRDSIRWEIRDSIRIHEATRYKDMAWLGDSLKIEGARSRMWAVADTTREALIGGLEEDRVEEKTKIIYKTKWMVKDSIRIEEKPVPYEVVKVVRHIPRFFKFCLWWFIGSIVAIALYLYLKFKTHISI